MSWGAFRLHMRAANDQMRERAEASSGFREGGYDPPETPTLKTIPWVGDGPDPLEALWEQS